MDTKRMIELLERHQYQEAIPLFAQAFQDLESIRLSTIRTFLDQPEETIAELLVIMDTALMGQWGRIAARYSYRKLKTPNALIWYCQELIDEHELVEAETLLKKLETSDLPGKTAEKLYSTMAGLLVRMRRFNEAAHYLEKYAELTSEPISIERAFYHLHRGDWTEAVQLLEEGKQDKKNGNMAYVILAQHYSVRGDLEQADRVVEEGLNTYPGFPKLLAEKVRILYAREEWSPMREIINMLNEISPYHDYRNLFGYYEAVSLYEERKWGELEQLLAIRPEIRKQSPFKKFSRHKAHASKKLAYRQVVQHFNYCLPASAEMLLSMFSTEISQDEIAEAVFETNGSSVSKVIRFFRKKGFHSVLFHGSEERFKKLIDSGAGVLITIDYPVESHVQLLTGYDDHLEVFTVQDPNFRELLAVGYDELDKEFGNNHALSLAVVPAGEKNKLDFLGGKEHEIAGRMLLLTENCDQPLRPEDTEWIIAHRENPIVAIYSVKYLSGMIDENTLDGMIQVVHQAVPDPVYRSLIIALAFVQANKEEMAGKALDGLAGVSQNPTYWYLQGRVSADQGEFQQAAVEFRRAAELEPTDYTLWSYQAISVSHAGDFPEGLRLSGIALDMNGDDDFVLVNHGLILFDAGRHEEARRYLAKALRNKKESAHIWYERANCDIRLERFHQAERGFNVAISLKPDYPEPYRELARMYEVHEGAEAAEAVLRKGLAATGDSYLLLMELGELGERSKKIELARCCYTKASEMDPEEPQAWMGLASLGMEEGNLNEFFVTMNRLKERFGERPDFLINGGKLIWEAAGQSEDQEKYMEQGLSFMEKGIRMAGTNLGEALEIYGDLIQNSPYCRRGIRFLEGQLSGKEDNRLYLLYAGILHGERGNYGKATNDLNKALKLKEDTLTLYSLGDIHFRMEDYEQATGYFKRALEIEPACEQALLGMASVASQSENRQEELHYLLEAFHVNPYSIPMEATAELMDHEQLKQFLDQIQNLNRKKFDKAFLYDSMAIIYGKLGQLDQEGKHLAKALEASPEMPQLLHHQAKFLFRKGEQKQARKLLMELIGSHVDQRELYETLIEFYGKSARLKNQIGSLKLSKQEKSIAYMNSAAAFEKVVLPMLGEQSGEGKQGVFTKWIGATKTTLQLGFLIDLYETAIKMDRDNLEAAAWFADFYMAVFLVGDAIKVLEDALAHRWDDDLAYKLVLLYIHEQETFSEKKRERHLSKAQSLLDKLQSRYKEPDYLFQLGFSSLLQENYPKAEEAFLECLKLDPETGNIHFFLGKVYAEMEQYPKAEQELKQAIELAPGDPDAWNELGIVYRLQGKTDEALECADQAVAIQPDDLFVQYNRACYLAVLGRFEESSRQLKQVFERDEDGYFQELSSEDEDLEPLKSVL